MNKVAKIILSAGLFFCKFYETVSVVTLFASDITRYLKFEIYLI